MAVDTFSKQRAANLLKSDLSRKGSVDEEIRDLVEYINQLESYFTTSSCSGRICIFEHEGDQEKKKGCRWLFTSHSSCSVQDLVSALEASQHNAWFKFEPFVLHTQCSSMIYAQMMVDSYCSTHYGLHPLRSAAEVEHSMIMLSAAVAAGFRNSGISVGKHGKIIVAVRSTHSLEAPITRNGRSLINNEYAEYLVELSSEKMKENSNRIKLFFDKFRKALSQSEDSSSSSKSKSLRNQKDKKNLRNKNSSDLREQNDRTSSLCLEQTIENKTLAESCLEDNEELLLDCLESSS